MIGQTLSHFRITAKLGEGGMGEVYRAEDTKLGREVAIKVLPEAVAGDPERLARFEREARVLASLNHPHIAAIYSIESATPVGQPGVPLASQEEEVDATLGQPPVDHAGDDEVAGGDRRAQPRPTSPAELADHPPRPIHFLVMELIEGEDLKERLDRGALPFDAVLPLARQTAVALEAAHEKGIIHRDLKPANIKIDADGQVKILDFGLAKAMDPSTMAPGSPPVGSEEGAGLSPTALSLSPTLTAQMTGAGVILGTAAYMSPEQAKGEPVDKRSDIWAFGLVVFEALTGQRLFAADSVAETLAGVIKTEIDFSALPDEVPSSMVHLLRRCLERDPRNRLHDIADARIVIDDQISGRIAETSVPALESEAAPARWKTALPWALAALGLTIGLLSLWSPLSPGSRTRPSPPSVQFEIRAPADTSLISGLALSPDGTRLAFVSRAADGRTEIWVRDLDSLEVRRISGTTDARHPFWAPSGREIGFFAESGLKVTDLLGSAPRIVVETDVSNYTRGAAWSPDGTIVFAPSFSGGLMRIAASGGSPEAATQLQPDSMGTHRFPRFLPDGKHFVFYGSPGVGSEPGTLFVGELGSLEVRALGPSSSFAVFAEPDSLLYVRGETLVAHRIDLDTLELVDEPQVVGVTLPGSFTIAGQRSLTSVSGVIAYRMDTRSNTQLVWADRAGNRVGEISGDLDAWHNWPELSPDGNQLIVGAVEKMASTGNIWHYEFQRGIANPLQAQQGHEQAGIWSPEGDRIVYTSTSATGEHRLVLASVANPNQTETLYQSRINFGPEFWTPDGRHLGLSYYTDEGDAGLWTLDLDMKSEPTPLFSGPGSRWGAHLAPDGRWVAYVSDESRRPEVYARPLDREGPVLRVSASGGLQPIWGSDGRELFYVNPAGEIVVVSVTAGDPLVFGRTETLFNARLEDSLERQYDVAPGGQRFVLNQRSDTGASPIVVATDWRRLLGGSDS